MNQFNLVADHDSQLCFNRPHESPNQSEMFARFGWFCSVLKI